MLAKWKMVKGMISEPIFFFELGDKFWDIRLMEKEMALVKIKSQIGYSDFFFKSTSL